MSMAGLAYLAGVVVGLWRTDGAPRTRVAVALLWPLGPLAFAITITVLLAASLVAFPLFGGAVALAAGLLWWVTAG
jgi:hypothetical protein